MKKDKLVVFAVLNEYATEGMVYTAYPEEHAACLEASPDYQRLGEIEVCFEDIKRDLAPKAEDLAEDLRAKAIKQYNKAINVVEEFRSKFLLLSNDSGINEDFDVLLTPDEQEGE